MSRPRVVCVIQARMTSSRLPGKVLLELAARPVLEHVIRRCQKARLVDEVVVAMPDEPASEPMEQLCLGSSVRSVRGSELDVLERYATAVRETAADVVVRVTSDCPLIDPTYIDVCVMQLLASQLGNALDYFSNVEPRRLPRGLDVEVFTAKALLRAAEAANAPAEREHVTVYLRESGEFRTGGLRIEDDFSDLRWTLDTPADLAMFRQLFERGGPDMDALDALRIVRADPSIPRLNAEVVQKPL